MAVADSEADRDIYTHVGLRYISIISDEESKRIDKKWNDQYRTSFRHQITTAFVNDMVLQCVNCDIKKRLEDKIDYSTKRSEFWVSIGRYWGVDDVLEDAKFPGLKLRVTHVFYQTDALECIAKAIGPRIKVKPLWLNNTTSVILKVEWWPEA